MGTRTGIGTELTKVSMHGGSPALERASFHVRCYPAGACQLAMYCLWPKALASGNFRIVESGVVDRLNFDMILSEKYDSAIGRRWTSFAVLRRVNASLPAAR